MLGSFTLMKGWNGLNRHIGKSRTRVILSLARRWRFLPDEAPAEGLITETLCGT
jgi:hypothetical protein